MFTLDHLLILLHLLGLGFAVGAATLKLLFIYRCKKNPDFIPVFLKVLKPITGILLSGLILLTVTGIVWVIMSYSFTSLLIVKVVLVTLIWLIGPIIDKVVEPKFVRQGLAYSEESKSEFKKQWTNYFFIELIADLIIAAVIVLGIML